MFFFLVIVIDHFSKILFLVCILSSLLLMVQLLFFSRWLYPKILCLDFFPSFLKEALGDVTACMNI